MLRKSDDEQVIPRSRVEYTSIQASSGGTYEKDVRNEIEYYRIFHGRLCDIYGVMGVEHYFHSE